MESVIGKFWRYDNLFFTLYPVDESDPRYILGEIYCSRQGGKVKVQGVVMDWRTFTPQYKTLYGIYADDFISFGEY